MPSMPSSVRLTSGQGGLPVVTVQTPAARAELYLHGAHLTAWNPAGEPPVLWLSRASRFARDAAIRGGVPLCFPWFGAHRLADAAPAHGFARLRDWELVEAYEDADDVVLTLRLVDDATTRASDWPHRFEALYTVRAGRRLALALTVTSTDTVDLGYEAALHTYLAVTDIRRTSVTGLEGQEFIDRLSGPHPQPGEQEPLRFGAETDRIYLGSTSAVAVTDEASGRTTTVSKKGSAATVVWNPWAGKAAGMSDVAEGDWTQMLCVETANLRSTEVRLTPGASHTMTAEIDVRR